MGKLLAFGLLAALCLAGKISYAQSVDSVTDKVFNFPSKLFGKIRKKTADLNQQLTQQTTASLEKMMKQEARMQKKLSGVDSNAAKSLFASSQQQYATLIQKLKSDTGNRKQLTSLTGTYQPYADSLQGSLAFLQKNPQLLGGTVTSAVAGGGQGSLSPQVTAQLGQLQGATSEMQAYQAKLQDASQAQAFIQQRKQQLSQYISQHTDLQSLLDKPLAGLNQQAYYYSQQLRQYRDQFENPDQLEQKALSLLNQLPSFQAFMKSNSQLAGLFSLPGSYATPQGLTGLQTRDQVAQLVQNQVAAGGANGAASLQSNLSSAESQLDGYKDKLSQLGSGNGDIDLPNFKPNDQKTKTFWKRLEYGTNFQTTHDSYYFPTVTDLGLSLAYKLGHSNDIGIGASYKIGWGNGIQHIALSSQGIGLRSFIDIKIKSSFSATGGFEYNYTTPFPSFSQLPQIQDWTKSGLIGMTKTISLKSRVFQKTTLSLLWDFLSYQQVPKTQPILFRVGYKF